mgnify:CR=1 FL=1
MILLPYVRPCSVNAYWDTVMARALRLPLYVWDHLRTGNDPATLLHVMQTGQRARPKKNLNFGTN